MISVKEAREILGEDAEGMTDNEIEFTVETLGLIAKEALRLSKVELHRKRDAYRLAELVYDCYGDEDGQAK